MISSERSGYKEVFVRASPKVIRTMLQQLTRRLAISSPHRCRLLSTSLVAHRSISSLTSFSSSSSSSSTVAPSRFFPSRLMSSSSLFFCKRTLFHNSQGLEFLPMDMETFHLNKGTPDELEFIQYNGLLDRNLGSTSEPPSVIVLHEVSSFVLYVLFLFVVLNIYFRCSCLFCFDKEWGLTAHIKHLAQDIANEVFVTLSFRCFPFEDCFFIILMKGFNVITPDLFRGKRTNDPGSNRCLTLTCVVFCCC